jgi:hypothetical protein
MGKVVIIMVMGLSIAFGIISWSLSSSSSTTADATMGYAKYSTARNIARSAINLKLRSIDDNKPVGQTLSGSMMGGTYRVDSIFASNDSIGFRSTATYTDTVYKIRTMMQRTPKPFPEINSAVGLRIDNVNFDMSGQADINGNNHDIDGNLISPSVLANDKTGVEVMIAADSIEAAVDASKIFGYPTKIKINPAMANPADFVQEYINSADYTYGPGTYSAQITWGSVTNPVIVFCDGTAGIVHFSGQCEGWGVLVVKGNLKASGQFTFHGLVVPFSDTIIDFDPLTGQAKIVGAILMGGATGSSFEMKGQATVKYSKDALQKAKMIGKLLFYRVLSWYEDYK